MKKDFCTKSPEASIFLANIVSFSDLVGLKRNNHDRGLRRFLSKSAWIHNQIEMLD